MAKFTVTRRIERPRNEVFKLFTNFDEMPRLIDKISSTDVEGRVLKEILD